jgi:hypothetical protein
MSRETTKAPKEPRSKQHDTFVFPDECACAECRSEVTSPQVVTRDPPKPMYLRYQVNDITPKGLSHFTEVEEVAQQILQDVLLDVIPINYGVQRLQAIRMQIVRNGKDELASEDGKARAYDILDTYLTKIRLKQM